MFEKTSLALKYVTFALIATAVNVGAQDLATRAYSGDFSIFFAMVLGTGVGLITKYWLDKKYIFQYITRDKKHEGSTFAIYSAMGLLTTVIFWAFEFGFDYFFDTKKMRYIGAIIGLGIGYLIKYRLDKKFVFKDF